ncbi:barstar family protein [Sphingomonas sp.]|uniref:barstar family protein n=1 Tax=Sphingomonas sp. TaxID=28214 RepID=UPI003D6CD91B
MKEVIVDCSGIISSDELWQRYIDAAQPENASMFGRNLDAFGDAVEGRGPGWPGEIMLTFKHSEQLRPLRMRGGNGSFLDALKGIADRSSVVKIDFA